MWRRFFGREVTAVDRAARPGRRRPGLHLHRRLLAAPGGAPACHVEVEAGGAVNAVAAEVAGFRPEEHLRTAEVARFDRVSQFALAAARQALGEARLDLERVDRTRIGVILATTLILLTFPSPP
jgi:3-oxoacyl-(acyl-carrier-protein) synthase